MLSDIDRGDLGAESNSPIARRDSLGIGVDDTVAVAQQFLADRRFLQQKPGGMAVGAHSEQSAEGSLKLSSSGETSERIAKAVAPTNDIGLSKPPVVAPTSRGHDAVIATAFGAQDRQLTAETETQLGKISPEHGVNTASSSTPANHHNLRAPGVNGNVSLNFADGQFQRNLSDQIYLMAGQGVSARAAFAKPARAWSC